MKTIFLLMLPFLFSCSHAKPDRTRAEEESAIAQLPVAAVESGLELAGKDISEIETRIRSAESRRNSLRLQQGANSAREGAVEGVEAELDDLRARRSALEHRRHLLEARQRELRGD